MSTEVTGQRRLVVLGGAAAVTLVGVFSKESAVTVIGVIVLYELTWWKERREVKGRLAGLLAIGIPILLMLLQRARVMSAAGSASFPFLDNPISGSPFLQGKLTALAVMARYVWRLACPITLSADYSYNQIPLATGTVTDWISWLVVAALAAGVILAYRRNSTVFFLAGFAAVSFVPVSNLLFPIGTIMAERFLYLPAVAFCGCLVLGWTALPGRFQKSAPLAVGLLAGAYAARTFLRNPDWQDDLTMAKALVKTSPNSFKVEKMLAFQSFRSDPTHPSIDQVIAIAENGLTILNPVPDRDNNAEAYRFAGGYYFNKGDALRGHDQNGRPVASPLLK
jgi:hypothetical protein